MLKQSNKNGSSLLVFMGWLMYTTSYLGKYNYSANINSIMEFYDVTKPEAGMVPTLFFFAYGIGQVVNGLLCKKYNIKWMIFLSLMTSSVVNFIIALSTNFSIIKWLWLVNGFVMSVLWPTLIRMLSENLPKKELGRSSVVIGTTVASGTIIIYSLSAIFTAIGHFKLAFYVAALAGGIVSLLWIILYDKAIAMSRADMTEEDLATVGVKATYAKVEQTRSERKIFLLSIYALCFCAIGVNLVKDGLNTWVPTILKEEYGMPSSLSIILTLTLPIVTIFGNAFAVAVHKRIPDYVTHSAIGFSVIGVIIGVVIGSLSWGSVVIMLVCLGLTALLAGSLNSLVTSIFPMFMRGKVNSGLFAGILNGFCYVGSTISSYGLGAVAENHGWSAAFFVLIGFCAAVAVIWVAFTIYKYFLNRKEKKAVA